MTTEQEIEKLRSDIFSTDEWEVRKSASSRLSEIGGKENIDYLIGLLNQENGLVRNAVAMTFMDNKFNDALEPLFDSINRLENRNARGTMVYALKELDCSQKLKELFDLLYTAIGNFEVQSAVLTVLEEQEFEFSKGDLVEINEKWEELKENWNPMNNINGAKIKEYEIDRDVVQNFVDGYVSYL